jgi:hypothetical protein
MVVRGIAPTGLVVVGGGERLGRCVVCRRDSWWFIRSGCGRFPSSKKEIAWRCFCYIVVEVSDGWLVGLLYGILF